MKKKLMLVFAIILIIFNLIFSKCVFAEPTTTATSTEGTATATPTTTTTTTDPAKQGLDAVLPRGEDGNILDMSPITNTIQEEVLTGTSTITLTNSTTTETTNEKRDTKKDVNNSYGAAGGALTAVWGFLVVDWLNNIPQIIVQSTGSKVQNHGFTIYDLVIGNYEFFNLDFYDMDKIEKLEDDSLAKQIISNIFKFYVSIRNLAIALSLFVLLYIAIRMVISTTAIERSKYKNMFTAWFTSVCILFFMQYIIIIISYLTHAALEIIRNIADSLGVDNIEIEIMRGQMSSLKSGKKGFHLFQTLIMVTVFLFYELKFLIAYIKRFCEMVFLIIISPLVTVTYAIDKAGDNRAQAFTMWFKELLSKYMLQVVHAVTYVLFIAAAGEIAKTMPLLAAFFLWAMGRAEIIIRNVVGLQTQKQVERAKPPRPPGLPRFLRGRHGH